MFPRMFTLRVPLLTLNMHRGGGGVISHSALPRMCPSLYKFRLDAYNYWLFLSLVLFYLFILF